MSRVFSTTIMKKIARIPNPATAMIKNSSTLRIIDSTSTAANSGPCFFSQVLTWNFPAGRAALRRSTTRSGSAPSFSRIWIRVKAFSPDSGSIIPRIRCNSSMLQKTRCESYSLIPLLKVSTMVA